MKTAKRPKLNTRLLAVFFLAVFVLAMAEFLVFAFLLRSINQEEQIISRERLANAQIRLDTVFGEIEALHTQMLQEQVFFQWKQGDPELYDLFEMYDAGKELFGNQDAINSWAILLKDTNYVVSNTGVLTLTQYAHGRHSETYPIEYWDALRREPFGIAYYPAAAFTYLDESVHTVTRNLIPMAVNPYYNNKYMLVLFLDIEQIFRDSDTYLGEGTYLFRGDELLYTSDETPLITDIPQQEVLMNAVAERYAVQSTALKNGLTLVKLQTEREAASFLRSSFVQCIVVALGALALAVTLVPVSVKRMMDPVNRMFGLIQQHAEAKDPGFRFDACRELEVILKNREQQAAALAQRDAVLSEYFLQSRLKNVYVDMYSEEQHDEGRAYILYIQVQYQQACHEQISMPRAELESCIQGMLSSTLSNLFETTMVFQLEPGRFAARVTLPREDDRIESRMQRFMDRLEIEQEFAYFTVIRSQVLEEMDELSAVYTQVQEAARMARVCDRSQLLTLPMPEREETAFVYTQQEEKKIHSLLSEQNLSGTVELAERILDENLRRGISHMQMEVLCVALVNTAAHATTKLNESADKIAAASGVYNAIISRCGTAKEYRQTVTDFIRSMGASRQPVAESDPMLDRVRQYLQENYQREFSGEEMAAALHVSRSYLSTYYKSKTGINLSESIQIFRMQKAVELLREPDIRIGDVGPLVGIPSSNTFLRWFKKYTGMTPNEYRGKVLDN